jgi:hypothetical protein
MKQALILPLVAILATASARPIVSQTTSPPATSPNASSKSNAGTQSKQDKKAAKAKAKADSAANKPGGKGATTTKQDATYALEYQNRATPQNPPPQ